MFIEQKYINDISSQLRNFKKKSNNLYNFSCPVCGDSSVKKSKARGYIYEKEGVTLFHCHNCGLSISFKNFLKLVDESLYKQYVFEKFGNNSEKKENETNTNFNRPKFLSLDIIKNLRRISVLKENNPVRKFVIDRKIPNNYHYKLFECPKFNHFINSIIPNKFNEDSLKNDETRLLIPFIDNNDNIHALQGRSLKKNSKTKYITIVLDESIPKIYGLDNANFNKTLYVFEGPIDSMFIPNSIATAGGDLISSIKGYDKDNMVIVYDNEPRSIETKRKIDKAIDFGYNVCIWPDYIQQKDINDMILSGIKTEQIVDIINKNTFKGLKAKMKIIQWSKV